MLNTLENEGVLGKYAIAGAMGATFYIEPVLTFDLDVLSCPKKEFGSLSRRCMRLFA
ncbi:MAG: hypothetical protein NTZ51_06650 [Proteobacteria bacterium]|nr:hypothetical protein [Pseudomonadota bacterium]